MPRGIPGTGPFAKTKTRAKKSRTTTSPRAKAATKRRLTKTKKPTARRRKAT